MRTWLIVLCLALWGASWLLPAPAHAQTCSVSAANVNFGTINTVRNQQYKTTTAVNISCSGTANTQMRVCTFIASGTGGASANGPRQMAAGANKMNFDLFTDANYTVRWANDLSAGTNQEALITLSSSGNATASIPVYARIPSGQTTVPAGNYSSTFSSPYTRIVYGDTASYTSCSASGPSAQTFSFTASANNLTSCSLTTTTMSFGSASQITANIDATATINVTCAPSTPYAITMDGGTHGGTSAATRAMASGSSTITYGIYRDSNRSIGWYNDSNGTYNGTADGTTQSITAYGRVPPQATPPSGSYTDSVVVTVTY